jgi:hypothetical protein
MLAGNAVCGSTKTAAGFVRSVSGELPDSYLQLARVWRRVPWVFSAFRVTEDRGNDVVIIDPVGDPPPQWPKELGWKGLPLYSEAVARSFRHGTDLFLTQICYSGHAFLTHGMVISFRAITEQDLLFFANVTAHARQRPSHREPLVGLPGRTSGVSALIGRDPLPFLRLFQVAGSPAMASRDGEMRALRAWAPLYDSAPETERELTQAIRNGGEPIHASAFGPGAGALFLGEGSPMYDPEVYITFDERRLFLHAFSPKAYRRGRRAVSSIAPIPEQAHVNVSLNIYSAATDILGLNDVLSSLQERFDEVRGDVPDVGPDTAEEDGSTPTMEELQAIADRVFSNYNEGIEETPAQIARELGIDEAVVASVAAQLGRTVAGIEDRAPAADRLGLSPRAFAALSAGGVPRAKGALVLRSAAEIREIADRESAAAELLRATEPVRFASWLLGKAVTDGFVQATASGYVATAVVKQALRERVIPSALDRASEVTEDSKFSAALEARLAPKKELDWPSFHEWRIVLERARLLVHDGKRFYPADDAPRLIASPADLYHRLLVTMFEKAEWDVNRYLGAVPYVREMAGFLFYAARELCADDTWASVEDLTDAFIAAVPAWSQAVNMSAAPSDEQIVLSARYLASIGTENMFLSDFAERFGLLEVRTEPDEAAGNLPWLQRPRWFKTTPLFQAVFHR